MTYLIRFNLILASVMLLSGCQTLPAIFSTDMESKYPAQRFSLQDNQTLLGSIAEVELEEHDSLATIGRYFGLGFDEIVRANPDLDPWIPNPGSIADLPMQFILPEGAHEGIVINLAAKRLYYFPSESPHTVYSYPVGIGRQGWRTPVGKTRITAKQSHPSWTPPASIRQEHARNGDPLPKVVLPGSDNPLGDYALYLGMRGYLIHGTNKPYGVGMSISHGCVRLYPEDIANLFRQTPVGTPVRIIDLPYLTAWDGNQLYLQAYPTSHHDKSRVRRQRNRILKRLKAIEKTSQQPLNWAKIKTVLDQQQGVPILITETSVVHSNPPQLSHPPFGYGETIPPELSDESWRLVLKRSGDEIQSKRLAAMLNHQGPPIPAHALEQQSHAIIVGPFDNKDDIDKVAGRIRREFAIESEILKPGEDHAEQTSDSAKNWFKRLAERLGTK